MRKIVLIIISIILPLSAQAVVPPAITLTTAIQRFSPPFCQEGLKGLAVAIEKCYQTTNDTSVTMDMCVLGDIAIAKILIQEKKADLSILDRKPSDIILDKTIPVTGLDSYLNLASIVKRLQMLSEVPRFYIFRYNVILPYLQHGADPVYKGITEHCKK